MEPEGGIAPPQSNCQAAKQMTGGSGGLRGAVSVFHGHADVVDGFDSVFN